MNFFKYFILVPAVLGAVSSIQALVAEIRSGIPVTGTEIAGAMLPVTTAIAEILPHANIPAALVTDISNAVADVLNKFFKK